MRPSVQSLRIFKSRTRASLINPSLTDVFSSVTGLRSYQDLYPPTVSKFVLQPLSIILVRCSERVNRTLLRCEVQRKGYDVRVCVGPVRMCRKLMICDLRGVPSKSVLCLRLLSLPNRQPIRNSPKPAPNRPVGRNAARWGQAAV